MKLTIFELAAYLPYGLKWRHSTINKDLKMIGCEYTSELRIRLTDGLYIYDASEIKPILRNLSDLTKEITHNGETFVPIDYFLGDDIDLILNAAQIEDMAHIPYNLIQKLLEWKFDVFNLIPNNLAININDSQNE